ncbi:hypothetical protein R1sor_002663 [Riccia sorocarpa]|uniref:F-box domain-containing protein n=1 Tax=Riccia sorocarpa TaxID=122646 RepID=A0ABD3H3L9_9MARC
MDHLPTMILHNVLAKADAKDCARAACVDRRWRQSVDEDSLWKEFCFRDFLLTSAIDESGSKSSSYKEAYISWHNKFARYPIPLVSRARQCWDRIKSWLCSNFAEVLTTLAPGVSWAEIEKAERQLRFTLPDSVRLLYQMCNGQVLPEIRGQAEDMHPDNNFFLGLLGGYHVYEHFVNVRLLSLKEMVKLTNLVLPRLYPAGDVKRIMIARSCNFGKFFFVDCNDGLVYVGTGRLEEDAEMMPCVPLQEPNSSPKDGMLRWLENFSHCLQNGMYGVRQHDYGFRSISLFPLKEPSCTQAITYGLQVKCAAVFLPELSRIEVPGESNDESYMFAYSVRMRLLEEGNRYCGKVMESAQLVGRHWIIRFNKEITGEVRGEAVIGLYPLLRAGGEEFVYESRSAQKGRRGGSMEGDFIFVPGRISKPEGAQFAAYIARFPLDLPDYIY